MSFVCMCTEVLTVLVVDFLPPSLLLSFRIMEHANIKVECVNGRDCQGIINNRVIVSKRDERGKTYDEKNIV